MGAGSSVKDYPFFYFTEVKKDMQGKRKSEIAECKKGW